MPNDPVPSGAKQLLERSFDDAIRAIDAAPSLTKLQKQQWCCSLRQIAKLLERPPESVVARWTAVHMPIASLHHAMAGRREKTLQNHRANVRRALGWFAGEQDVAPRGIRLSPEWSRLRDRLEVRGVRARLSGLMRYCSGKGVAPEDVGEATLDGYMAYRAATTRLDTSLAARREIARAWNARGDAIEEWPSRRLIEPPLKKAEGPTWDDFPEGLRRDIESYLAGLGRLRRGLTGKRIRPCKPSTIHTRRQELIVVIKRAARIVPLETLISLKVLLSPALVEQVLTAFGSNRVTDPDIHHRPRLEASLDRQRNRSRPG